MFLKFIISLRKPGHWSIIKVFMVMFVGMYTYNYKRNILLENFDNIIKYYIFFKNHYATLCLLAMFGPGSCLLNFLHATMSSIIQVIVSKSLSIVGSTSIVNKLLLLCFCNKDKNMDYSWVGHYMNSEDRFTIEWFIAVLMSSLFTLFLGARFEWSE